MSTWHATEAVLRKAHLSQPLLRHARNPELFRGPDGEVFPVIACASEILAESWTGPPGAGGPGLRYLVVADVPEPGLLRVVSRLGLRKPEFRLHVSRDPRVIHRLVVAQLRDHPLEGIVDAYVLLDRLILLLGDFSIREFPVRAIQTLRDLDHDTLTGFEIDDDGSFLYWPGADLHLGASQLLQAVDPPYLAEVDIRRLGASVAMGELLARKREQLRLRQGDIPGLSERQVRRIEQGVSRLTAASAEKFAVAFGVTLADLLDEASKAVAARTEAPRAPASASRRRGSRRRPPAR